MKSLLKSARTLFFPNAFFCCFYFPNSVTFLSGHLNIQTAALTSLQKCDTTIKKLVTQAEEIKADDLPMLASSGSEGLNTLLTTMRPLDKESLTPLRATVLRHWQCQSKNVQKVNVDNVSSVWIVWIVWIV